MTHSHRFGREEAAIHVLFECVKFPEESEAGIETREEFLGCIPVITEEIRTLEEFRTVPVMGHETFH